MCGYRQHLSILRGSVRLMAGYHRQCPIYLGKRVDVEGDATAKHSNREKVYS